MCCEPLPDDYDDAQELPAQKLATQALDVLAIHLPNQHVFPLVWAFAKYGIMHTSSGFSFEFPAGVCCCKTACMWTTMDDRLPSGST